MRAKTISEIFTKELSVIGFKQDGDKLKWYRYLNDISEIVYFRRTYEPNRYYFHYVYHLNSIPEEFGTIEVYSENYVAKELLNKLINKKWEIVVFKKKKIKTFIIQYIYPISGKIKTKKELMKIIEDKNRTGELSFIMRKELRLV